MNPAKPASSAPILQEGEFFFRDLNKNGRLDPYEDRRLPIEERIADLLSQMTLEEKAGLMFHTMIGMNMDGTLIEEAGPFNPIPATEMVAGRMINHFNVYQAPPPKQMAEWHNRLQALAESHPSGHSGHHLFRPGPRLQQEPGHRREQQPYSQWPEPIGLAATGDAGLVQEFGDIARQEYLAVGIRTALHPHGRPGHRAALGPHQRHLRRGRPT